MCLFFSGHQEHLVLHQLTSNTRKAVFFSNCAFLVHLNSCLDGKQSAQAAAVPSFLGRTLGAKMLIFETCILAD